MERNVYLLISDMHRSARKNVNRVDYQHEIDAVDKHIAECIKRYSGSNVNLIFLGDLYDRGYREVFSAIHEHSTMLIYKSMCKEIYSLVGNHELSFYAGNPFYTLFSSMGSKRVSAIQNKVWLPRGTMQIVNVVDQITDGDIVIHCNHYGTGIADPIPGKTNIGLFHQNVICKEILDSMQASLGEPLYGIQTMSFDKLEGYDYCFMGHMHKVYGMWDWTSEFSGRVTHLQYLSSLGRPNRTEVDNRFLERDVPAVIVTDGKLETIEHNLFRLPSEEECIKSDVVELQKAQYERVKVHRNIQGYNPTEDEPVVNILANCPSDEIRQYMLELIDNGNAIEFGVLREAMHVLNGGKL